MATDAIILQDMTRRFLTDVRYDKHYTTVITANEVKLTRNAVTDIT